MQYVMLKSTLIFLLSSALVVSQTTDFFGGCVDAGQEQHSGDCILAPPVWLRSRAYRHLAHLVLAKAPIQPAEGNLNTLLKLTRMANEGTNVITIKLEFTTVESTCNSSVAYSEAQCPPLGNENKT
nr:uncharacterized protein LOC129385363 isoform X2 [Dermacentor andersoni]